LGERTARYAMIIDHGKVVYAEKEPGRDVSVSNQPGSRKLDELMNMLRCQVRRPYWPSFEEQKRIFLALGLSD